MKTIIFGAKGMLGKDLAGVFSDWKPRLLDKDDIDIRDTDAVFGLIGRMRPDVVINAAAYTDVDGCETNREFAMSVNGEASGYLAAAAKETGAIFIHYSTDYVFHGDQKEGYSEDDEPGNPLNFYGETKLAAEKIIKEVAGNYYIIRTSWLFGLNGKNFVETILRKASKFGGQTPRGGSDPHLLRVVNDQRGKPTYTVDLAKRTREIIEADYAPGIYHVTNEPATTWHDFAKEILGGLTPQAGSDPAWLIPCASSEFPRPAKRPEYSILVNTKLPPMRIWKDAVGEYLNAKFSIK